MSGDNDEDTPLTWAGSFMDGGDAFYYGERLGLARAVVLARAQAEVLRSQGAPASTVEAMESLARGLLGTDGVEEALDYLNKRRS